MVSAKGIIVVVIIQFWIYIDKFYCIRLIWFIIIQKSICNIVLWQITASTMTQHNDFMNLDQFYIKTTTQTTMCFSDCSIWILSHQLHHSMSRLDIINESFSWSFSLKIGEILLVTRINGWIINIKLILIDQSHPIIIFMINNTKVIKWYPVC